MESNTIEIKICPKEFLMVQSLLHTPYIKFPVFPINSHVRFCNMYYVELRKVNNEEKNEKIRKKIPHRTSLGDFPSIFILQYWPC